LAFLRLGDQEIGRCHKDDQNNEALDGYSFRHN